MNHTQDHKPRWAGVIFTWVLLVWRTAFGAQVQLWLTSPQGSARFEQQATNLLLIDGTQNQQPAIEVDEQRTFQTIDGFGFCLTGGSAGHLARMSSAARETLLKDLFSTEGNGIGASYLRVTIGASDLNDHPYSYDDLPPGQTDPALAKFSLATRARPGS